MNNFSAPTKPTKESLIQYYTITLDPPIAMFVKRSGKITLVENYEEAKKVEADMDSIEKYSPKPELKYTTRKRPFVVN